MVAYTSARQVTSTITLANSLTDGQRSLPEDIVDDVNRDVPVVRGEVAGHDEGRPHHREPRDLARPRKADARQIALRN